VTHYSKKCITVYYNLNGNNVKVSTKHSYVNHADMQRTCKIYNILHNLTRYQKCTAH